MQIFGFYSEEVGFVKFIVKHVVLRGQTEIRWSKKFINPAISWASLGSSSLPDPTFLLFVCRFSGCLFVNLICPSIFLSIHLMTLKSKERELIRTFRFCRQIALPHCSIMCHRHVQAAHEDVEVEILAVSALWAVQWATNFPCPGWKDDRFLQYLY